MHTHLFHKILYTQTQGFRVDPESCTFGMVVKGRYKPKSNFAIELVTHVEAGDHTGFFANITRSESHTK